MKNLFSKKAFFFACGWPNVCRKTLFSRTKTYFQTHNSYIKNIAPILMGILGVGLICLSGWFLWRGNTAHWTLGISGKRSIEVEVAQTHEQQERGLSARDELCATCGMLFVFERPDTYTFWMQGMRFPLDIVWIHDSRVIAVTASVAADDTRHFTPPEAVDWVLELNAGQAQGMGIVPGSIIKRQ